MRDSAATNLLRNIISEIMKRFNVAEDNTLTLSDM
jgi:hypothetical protein